MPFFYIGQNLNQGGYEDSLNAIITIEKNDTLKAAYLNELAFELRRNEPLKSVKYGKEALSIYEKHHSKLGINYSLYIIGTAYMNLGEHTMAFEFLIRAKNSSKNSGDLKILGRATNNIGIIYIKQSNLNKALKYYLEALEIREKLGDKGEMASSYLNIGNVYYKQKNFPQALNFYLKARPLFDERKNAFGLANLYHNIGLVFQRTGKFDSALHYFNTGLNMNKEIGDQRGVASAYGGIGELYFNKKMFNEAEIFFLKCMEINKKANNIPEVTESMEWMAHIKIDTKKLNEAENWLNLEKELLDKYYDLQRLSVYYEMRSHLDSIRGNCSSALLNYTKFKSCVDSLILKENTQMLVEQQMSYEFNKKENEIIQSQIQKDNLSKEELARQKIVTVSIAIGGVLLFVLLIISFSAFRAKKKSNLIITSQKEEVENKNKIIEEKQQSIIDSITYAKRLQQAILPNQTLIDEYFPQNFILYQPKDIVAGDFYWVAKKEEKYFLAVCDCTGHGVPGAFMSLLNIGFLSEAIKEKNILSPDLILNYVRDRLINSIGTEGRQDGMDAMLFCFDRLNNKITYSAAQNKPILINNGEINILTADKMPVGKGVKTDPFNLYTVKAAKGDVIYLYTDGYADQFGGPNGKKLMNKEMESFLLSIHHQAMEKQNESLKNKFDNWKGGLEQIDDVLVMGIKI